MSAQNIAFISPLTDSTSFTYTISDSSSSKIGSLQYIIVGTTKSKTAVKCIQVINNDTTENHFTVTKDTLGYYFDLYYFIDHSGEQQIDRLSPSPSKTTAFYPSTFKIDTLKDVSFHLEFKHNNLPLSNFNLSLSNRIISRGSFLNTPWNQKYCYKLSYIKEEKVLFATKTQKINEWFSNKGLIKREVYEGEKLTRTYTLTTIHN